LAKPSVTARRSPTGRGCRGTGKQARGLPLLARRSSDSGHRRSDGV